MRGPGPHNEESESRRLTPSIGLAPDSEEVPSDTGNEDFLFHLYRGSELLQDNRAHEAKEELERALRMQPNDTKGQDLLALVYFRLGHYPRAIAIYMQLRGESPEDATLLLNLALCYLKTGQAELARRELEILLKLTPGHARAWGYLGLACERIGDLRAAEDAFDRGGHVQLARRIAQRRASAAPPPLAEARVPSREVREVVATAFEELDAGDLSFALAEPADSPHDGDQWSPVELGALPASVRPRTLPASVRPETLKPDTRDGPPPSPIDIPGVSAALSGGRRPTLIVGVPPAQNHPDLEIRVRPPSPRPPTFDESESTSPSARRALVAVPPVRSADGDPSAASFAAREPPVVSERIKTLPPPIDVGAPPPADYIRARPSSAPPPPVEKLAEESVLAFPKTGHVLMHPSGVALVHTTEAAGFSARLEAIRAVSNNMTMKPLERLLKGKATGESFGGIASPIAHASGEGRLVLAPRPGRKLSSFAIEDDLCFTREEVLLGFDGALAYENGRLATGEGESVAVVQLRGKGAILIEAIGQLLTLEVTGDRGISVRRDVIIGWFGRLVPRALATNEAPCGQRGLVSFSGEGRVLVASA